MAKGEHWSAEQNGNYERPGLSGWVIRYDPTPGGTKNADGSTSYSMNFPALALIDWVGEPEKVAGEIATALNAHDDLVAALREAESFMAGFEGDELQEGIDAKLATTREALAKATDAVREREAV